MSMTQHAHSQIYKWVDKNGKVQFSDQKPPQGQKSENVVIKINRVKNVRKSVIMYSASWCGVCMQAKKHFTKKAIPYTEYDIERSIKGRNDFARLGGQGVPIILIGHQRMDGFDASKFEKLYRH